MSDLSSSSASADSDTSWQPPTFVSGFHNEQSVRRTTYRRLGNTNLVVSRLSLGGGPFGGLYGDCENVAEIVETAIRNGVSYIDTSYWYGQGRSEEAIGKALKRIPRRAYYVGTKVGRYELDYARMFDFSSVRTLKAVDDSLRRLRLCCIDLIQVHDFEFAPSEEVILNETLPALDMARKAGKVRYIGITGYPLAKMASILSRSTVKIDAVLSYCRGTLHDGSLGQYMHFFQQYGVGVVNAAPTSMGLLSSQGPPPWHPAPANIQSACQQAEQYCQRKGVSLARLANFYSMNFPGVHTCLAGCHSVDVLLDNLKTSWTIDLGDKERRVRDRIMRRYFDPLANANWEDLEVQKYWRKLKAAGIPIVQPYVQLQL